MSSQNDRKDYQDELDVYQAAWVIGKQRGEEMPVDAEKLKMLLDAGRIGTSVLNKLEKEKLGDLNQGWSEKSKQGNGLSLENAKMIVKGLMAKLSEEIRQTVGGDGWENLGEKQKTFLLNKYFFHVYGMGRSDLLDLLIKGDMRGK